MRLLFCVVPCLTALAAASLCAADPPRPMAAPTTVASDAERAAITRVVEALIAGGAPDSRGATVILGEVVVAEPAPETKSSVSREYSGFDERVSNGEKKVTYRGCHLLLADGRWLMQLSRLVAPIAQRTITPSAEAKHVPPARLLETLAAQPPGRSWDADDNKEWLDVFTPESRQRVEATQAMAKSFMSLQFQWGGGLALPLLHRAGVPGCNEMMLLSGMSQIWPWYNKRIDHTGPLILDSSGGHYDNWGGQDGDDSSDKQEDPETWMTKHKGTITLPDPTPVLNLQIADWFRGLLLDERSRDAFAISTEQAAKQVLVFTPESQRASVKAELDLLIAAQALPKKAPAGADLAVKLQSWQTEGRRGGGSYGGPTDEESDGAEAQLPDEAIIAQMPAEIQEDYRQKLEQRAAWRPTETDVPGLIALLDDARPSRWIDGRTSRTVGDNALRALYTAMRVDPRLLVGHNPLTPWTTAERTASAAAISTWWKGLGGKPMNEGIIDAIERLPLGAAASLIAKRKPDERAPLLDRIAKALPATPGKDITGTAVSQLLVVAESHPGIASKIGSWPVAGKLRPLLAVWNDGQNRPGELDKLLDELIAAGNADDQSAGLLNMGLKYSMLHASPARLQRCLALAAGPVADRRTWAVLGAAGEQNSYYDASWMAVEQLSQGNKRRFNRSGRAGNNPDPSRAIALAVTCTMLADRRPIGDSICTIDVQERGEWAQLKVPGLSVGVQLKDSQEETPEGTAELKPAEQKPKLSPTGLRVCDVAFQVARTLSWRIGEHELGNATMDLWAEATTRDTALRPLADAFGDKARADLAAAKLPDVLPVAAPVDVKALF